MKSGSFPYDGASDDLPEFTYSLYPHTDDFRKGGVVEAAYVLNRGLQAEAPQTDNPLAADILVCTKTSIESPARVA